MGEYSTNIGIRNDLYEKLKERKSPGQSFSGVIEELLHKAEEYEEQQSTGSVQETATATE
jgi:predicted CopG family antitoxin